MDEKKLSKINVSHVIFDMDGLILDTERLYTEITEVFIAPYGKQFSWDIKSQLMGKSRNEATTQFLELYGIPMTEKEADEKFEVLYQEKFPDSKLLPGAEKLIRHLHRHGIPIAVATGSDSHVMRLKTENHVELFSLFHHFVTGDDPRVRKSKPSPDAFLVALAGFDSPPPPQQALVFEDSVNGVAAANAAGMQCVWVPDKWMDTTNTPPAHTPTLRLRSLSEFDPTAFGLPPFDS